jgi:hypothetical protein
LYHTRGKSIATKGEPKRKSSQTNVNCILSEYFGFFGAQAFVYFERKSDGWEKE